MGKPFCGARFVSVERGGTERELTFPRAARANFPSSANNYTGRGWCVRGSRCAGWRVRLLAWEWLTCAAVHAWCVGFGDVGWRAGVGCDARCCDRVVRGVSGVGVGGFVSVVLVGWAWRRFRRWLMGVRCATGVSMILAIAPTPLNPVSLAPRGTSGARARERAFSVRSSPLLFRPHSPIPRTRKNR